MVFSAVPSTSYRRTISPGSEGQPRREGNNGQLFTLQARQVANDDAAEITLPQSVAVDTAQPLSSSSLEKWMRLMGAARQMAYQADEQPVVSGDPTNMRYRLQRTYFDQERQVSPRLPATPDPRLQAYRHADSNDDGARMIDFVI